VSAVTPWRRFRVRVFRWCAWLTPSLTG